MRPNLADGSDVLEAVEVFIDVIDGSSVLDWWSRTNIKNVAATQIHMLPTERTRVIDSERRWRIPGAGDPSPTRIPILRVTSAELLGRQRGFQRVGKAAFSILVLQEMDILSNSGGRNTV